MYSSQFTIISVVNAQKRQMAILGLHKNKCSNIQTEVEDGL